VPSSTALQTVLVTRPEGQGSVLAELLVARGFRAEIVPATRIVPMAKLPEVRADWVGFTSQNGVRACAKLDLGSARLVAVGPATASLAETTFGRPCALFRQLPPGEGKTIVLLRGDLADDALPLSLEALGFGVRRVTVYRTEPLAWEALPPRPDVLAFASGSAFLAVSKNLERLEKRWLPEIPLASIGPITTRVMRARGCVPRIEAAEPTLVSLADAIARWREGA
jgi:uroporphyrinogen-III synthase